MICKVNKRTSVEITLRDTEIDDMVRILHVAYESFSGENRIDAGHCKTPYVEDARKDARKLIKAIYDKLPCDWSKPNLI